MSTYFDTVAEAVAHSRNYNEIATVRMADLGAALDALKDACTTDEDYDYVKQRDVLEFWAFDPETEDCEQTMRVHVALGE